MRSINLPALTVFFTMILLMITIAVTLIGYEKQPAELSINASAAASAVPVTLANSAKTVALPNFTALVKKEGAAVINISTSRRVRGGLQLPAFPGAAPDDLFHELFRRLAPGDELPREFRSLSLGSGFIISADGYILTNAHVVEDAEEVTVRLTDQREFIAKVLGSDRRSDIALLKITANNLPVVNIGNSSKLDIGEWVVAIGSPFGFTNSVSQGIVSAKGRSLPGENIVPFIQTDVPVNPGNSGGPLFNMNGEVIGINSQIFGRSGGHMGLSFAIPIDLAMKVKNELLKHGVVRRGRLGVTIQNVSPEHARTFELKKASGALITSVEKNGPGDRAGLEIGDIILKFNSKNIGSTEELMREIADSSPGSNTKLQLWRHAATMEVTVSLGEAEGDRMAQKQGKDKAAEPGQLGLVLRELTRDEQRALHTDGFLLAEAVAGVAVESGIQPGDIIIAINSQRVSSIKQLRTELAKIGKRAAVLVHRDGDMVFMPLKFID